MFRGNIDIIILNLHSPLFHCIAFRIYSFYFVIQVDLYSIIQFCNQRGKLSGSLCFLIYILIYFYKVRSGGSFVDLSYHAQQLLLQGHAFIIISLNIIHYHLDGFYMLTILYQVHYTIVQIGLHFINKGPC